MDSAVAKELHDTLGDTKAQLTEREVDALELL